MMPRITVTLMLALGAMLAVGTAARAGDNGTTKNGFSGGPNSGTTATLGGKGTAATAAASGDSELTWYHGYRGGFWRGYYAGYYGGYYGYPGFYAGYPVVASYYTAPVIPTYSVGYYSPYYAPVVGPLGRFRGFAVGIGVNGVATDVVAPAMPLNGGAAIPAATPALPSTQQTLPSTQQVLPAPKPSSGSTVPSPMPPFRYDGGPNNPVPIPKIDSSNPSGQAIPPLPPETGLPVSLTKAQSKPAAKPYSYKGYGEK